jgi:hypothetical protein
MEQFFVELTPDFDQKRAWRRLEERVKDVVSVFEEEISRQVSVLGSPMAKNLYLESRPSFSFEHGLSDLAVLRVKEAVHDTYRPGVRKGRNGIYPVEVDPKEVHFSTVERLVRIPYLGLVKHRHNNKILSHTDGTAWLMGNVTSMRLTVRNNYLCLVIDCREDPTPKRAREKKPSWRSSKWLK